MSRRHGPNPPAQAPLALPPVQPTGPMPKAARIAYFRVSTTDQSIEAQRTELGGGPYDREFTDEGVSGSTLMAQRAGFAELLKQVREGDTVFVAAIDRLGRDAIDVQSTVRNLLNLGVIIDVKGLGPIGRGVGELIVAVLAQVAEMEKRRIMDRSKAGLATAKESLARTGKTHRGKDSLGRPFAANAEIVIAWKLQHRASIQDTARHFNIGETTVKRYMRQYQAPKGRAA